MTSIFKVASLSILALLQLLFLTALFYDLPKNVYGVIFIAMISLLVLMGNLTSTKASNNTSYNGLWIVLYTIIAAISTYILAIELTMGTVIASALVGTIGSFLPLLNKKPKQLNEISKVLCCGSFGGMTASLFQTCFQTICNYISLLYFWELLLLEWYRRT
ncbi:hypothetical protein JM83_2755 [Gillisia sp. Hel_I_86]|uniref:hypothetical protein n=1 Tax=Gillisia sp. Hel_I_86 TaxID=1249981 RepID=UPI00119BB9EC|nr:hypothetical protein [Gillisia sp. Hel_I_86]TVZ27695.1 hypothetical protein JM83_2755 [Gillisia sp. Hel_I_86]